MRGGTVNLNKTETLAENAEGSALVAPGAVALGDSQGEFALGGPNSENGVRQGQVVDRYRIVQLIASGGMSRVYEAVHVFTHKPVALKVMRARFSERNDVISRFRHEAVALSSIQHQNVVRVENAGLTDEGHVFLAMELLSGRNLREELQAQKLLGVRASLELVAGVATGVAAAHAIGIIHRDLKPENIFCTDTGAPKVLDLGTAKFAGDNVPTTQTAHGKIVGTAAYVAPERLEGNPGDERCDIYSLGLVLYECIAGVHPMAPEGTWPKAAEIASRQISFRPAPIRGLPEAVGQVIAKAIHKNPDKRYRSMLEFSEAIHVALLTLNGNRASPISVVPARNRRELRVPIAAGVILGVAAGGAVFQLRQTAARPMAEAPMLDVSAPAKNNSENRAETAVPRGGQGHALLDSPPNESGSTVSPMAVGHSPAVASVNGALARANGSIAAKPSGEAAAEAQASPSSGEVHTANSPRRGKANAGNPAAPAQGREDLPASGL